MPSIANRPHTCINFAGHAFDIGRFDIFHLNIAKEAIRPAKLIGKLGDDNVVEIVEIDISDSSPSEKRVITLSDISIDTSNGDVESDVHKVIVDSGDNVLEYKKLGVNELRRLAIERKLIDKGSKMKKQELVELLTNV